MNETELLAHRINRGMNLMAAIFIVPGVLLGGVVLGMIPGIIVGTYINKPLGIVVGVLGSIFAVARTLVIEHRRSIGTLTSSGR